MARAKRELGEFGRALSLKCLAFTTRSFGIVSRLVDDIHLLSSSASEGPGSSDGEVPRTDD